MSNTRLAYIIAIAIFLGVNLYYAGANQGWDIGYQGGYAQAILDGKVEVECKFPCQEGRCRE